MYISSGPSLAPRQAPASGAAASYQGFGHSAPAAGTPTASMDPTANSLAAMNVCLQCMSQMLQLMLAMTQGGQALPNSPGFGGDAGGPPGLESFLGGSSAAPSASAASSGGDARSGVASSPAASSTGDAQTSPAPDWVNKLPEPLRKLGPAFEKYGKQYNVDPRFLAAISMLETGNGTSSAFRNKNNAMGVSNSKGPIGFSAAEQSIEQMARVMSSATGPYKNVRTIADIGNVYAPVGAGNDVNGTNGHWPKGVSKFYEQLGGDPSKPVK